MKAKRRPRVGEEVRLTLLDHYLRVGAGADDDLSPGLVTAYGRVLGWGKTSGVKWVVLGQWTCADDKEADHYTVLWSAVTEWRRI